MKRASALILLLVLGIAPGCSKRALGQDEGRLSVGDGRVEVAKKGAAWKDVGGSLTLHSGDRVRVDEGTATVRLTSGRNLELRRGSQLEFGAPPRLLAGDLLATAESTPLHVSAAGTDVGVTDGRARLSRSLALVTAAYRGKVDLDSAGRTLEVPPLRQAAITAAGLIPERPTPLQYDPLDAWDRRELGDAIELGVELVARSRGFTAQLEAGEGRTTGFYRQLIPDLEEETSFDQALIDSARSPGETLVGAAIAAESRLGGFRSRWTNVFAFRDQGAAWGLVALDQAVTRPPLLAKVDAAIGRAVTPFNAVALPNGSAPTTQPPRSSPTTTPPQATPTTAPRTPAKPPATTPPSGPKTPPTSVPPVPPPVDQPTSGLLDTLAGLLDALLGGGR